MSKIKTTSKNAEPLLRLHISYAIELFQSSSTALTFAPFFQAPKE